MVFLAGGVLVGLVAIGFASLADRASDLFMRATGAYPWAALVVVPAGLALCVFLTRTAFPGAQGSGVPQVIASIHLTDPARVGSVLSFRVGVGKILVTLLGLASGASIGREGPTAQVGATIMHQLGRAVGISRVEVRRALILAGGAAGVSAAFNTPLAGVVFAIEELSHAFEARTSGLVVTAVILAGITTLSLVGDYTYFGISTARLTLGPGWLAVMLCAVAGGGAGGAFSRILLAGLAVLPGRIGVWLASHPVPTAALCGLVVACLGLASNGATYGTGYAQARDLLAGEAVLPTYYFVMKFAATAASYLSGIPGGIFAPSLAVGASLGHFISPLIPGAPVGAVVLLGMVAYFAGVVQAPITAFVIVLEMTGDHAMLIPLMATSLLAYSVSRLICPRALYGVLAERFAKSVS